MGLNMNDLILICIVVGLMLADDGVSWQKKLEENSSQKSESPIESMLQPRVEYQEDFCECKKYSSHCY